MTPLRLALAGFLALWLTACLPESENPVAAPDPAQQDPRLWGAWVHVAEDGFSVAHVFATEAHTLQVLWIDHDVEGIGGEPETYDAHVSKLPSGDFLNVLVKGSETGYLVAKYVFKGKNTVSIAFLTDAALTDAVKAGALPGTIGGEGGAEDVRITATAQQWQAFLANPPKDLFDDPVDFERVGPAYVSE